jgi:hypothetical protein
VALATVMGTPRQHAQAGAGASRCWIGSLSGERGPASNIMLDTCAVRSARMQCGSSPVLTSWGVTQTAATPITSIASTHSSGGIHEPSLQQEPWLLANQVICRIQENMGHLLDLPCAHTPRAATHLQVDRRMTFSNKHTRFQQLISHSWSGSRARYSTSKGRRGGGGGAHPHTHTPTQVLDTGRHQHHVNRKSAGTLTASSNLYM